jgi:LysM repeat protein
LFENFLTFVGGVLYGSLIRTGVRKAVELKSFPGLRKERVGVKTMSQIRHQKRSRKANIRLARFLVVLSLTTVFGAGFAMQAGAGSKVVPTKPDSYVTVTVAPGETIWSVAKALNNGGDVRELVDQIIKVNGLASSDLTAGSKIRVPLN